MSRVADLVFGLIVAGGLVAACSDETEEPTISLQGEAQDPAGDGGTADFVFASG